MKKGNLVEWTPRMLTPPYEQGNIGIVTELDKLLKKAKVHWIKKPHCFEKNGVLKDVSDNDSVIETIDAKYYQKLIEEHIIADGMLPKLTNCFNAIEKNVSKVCVGKPSMLFQSDSIYTTLIKTLICTHTYTTLIPHLYAHTYTILIHHLY